MAEQHVLAVPIDAGKMAQQVARVGADAEVMKLAGIDRHFHVGVIISARSAELLPERPGAVPAAAQYSRPRSFR